VLGCYDIFGTPVDEVAVQCRDYYYFWTEVLTGDPGLIPGSGTFCGSGASRFRQYFCKYSSAESRRKNFNAGARRRCTQNTQIASGLQLCLLLNFDKPRLEIKRVAHGR
jgi:hypothetical protein